MSVQGCARALPQRLRASEAAPDTTAVILAGGVGARFGNPRGKQYADLCGLPVVAWSLLAFDRAPSVGRLVLVVSDERDDEVSDHVLPSVSLAKPLTLARAGSTRQDSVYSGLQAADDALPYVAVHDAARPLVDVSAIEGCIACLREGQGLAGAICCAPVTDTLKLVEGRSIIATPDRSLYRRAQTPQVFSLRRLREAHRAARADAYLGTDDASLVERRGGRVACFPTSAANIKVTVPEDYLVAQALMRARLMGEGCGIDAATLVAWGDEQGPAALDRDAEKGGGR